MIPIRIEKTAGSGSALKKKPSWILHGTVCGIKLFKYYLIKGLCLSSAFFNVRDTKIEPVTAAYAALNATNELPQIQNSLMSLHNVVNVSTKLTAAQPTYSVLHPHWVGFLKSYKNYVFCNKNSLEKSECTSPPTLCN